MENANRGIAGKLKWIEENLDLTADRLTGEQARHLYLFYTDEPEKFFTYAILGFVQRRKRDRKQEYFSKAELMRFCGEFVLKVRLSMNKGKYSGNSYLFDIETRNELDYLAVRKNCLKKRR